LENAELNKQIYTPSSGEATYVLLFPPLAQSVKEIHYIGNEGKFGNMGTCIYNVSLEKSFDTLRYEEKRKIPDVITRRMNEEVAKTAHKKTADFDSDTFFDDSPARLVNTRLVGYIRGYEGDTIHPDLIMQNQLNGQGQQSPLTIYPNGYFESKVEIKMSYPQMLSFRILNEVNVDFYIEPGHTLAMILDWEDVLAADRFRDRRYVLTKTQFLGALAGVNEDLLYRKIFKPNGYEIEHQMKNGQPDVYKQSIEDRIKSNLDSLQRTLAQHPLSAKAIRLIENEIKLDAVSELLAFASQYQFRENPAGAIPAEFYEIMKTISFDDRSLLSALSANNFINLLSMSSVYFQQGNSYQPDIHPSVSLKEYFEEEGIQLSEEEIKPFDLTQKFLNPAYSSAHSKELVKELNENKEQMQPFLTKYMNNMLAYQRKYIKIDQLAAYLFNVAKRDEILRDTFHVGEGIVKDALMLRFFRSYDNNPDISDADKKVIKQDFSAYLSTAVAQKLISKKENEIR
jgi:hypothetical protein